MTTRLFPITLLLLFTACSAGMVGVPLPQAAAHRLHSVGQAPEDLGDLVYHGRVHRVGHHDAAFRYERRIRETASGWVASHLTFDATDTPVVLHEATFSHNDKLLRFQETHGQTGLTGFATVREDGALTIHTVRDGHINSSTERGGHPVHVGPSLFAFALEHWDALVAGETRQLRFLEMQAGRTYPFALSLESTDEDRTVFCMVASNALVRLAVPVMRITFDTGSRQPTHYQGLVPPLQGPESKLKKFNAMVEYQGVMEGYR